MSEMQTACVNCTFWQRLRQPEAAYHPELGECRRRAPVGLPYFLEHYLSQLAGEDEPEATATFTAFPRTSFDD